MKEEQKECHDCVDTEEVEVAIWSCIIRETSSPSPLPSMAWRLFKEEIIIP